MIMKAHFRIEPPLQDSKSSRAWFLAFMELAWVVPPHYFLHMHWCLPRTLNRQYRFEPLSLLVDQNQPCPSIVLAWLKIFHDQHSENNDLGPHHRTVCQIGCEYVFSVCKLCDISPSTSENGFYIAWESLSWCDQTTI